MINSIKQRLKEFRIISQDGILAIGLLVSSIFLVVFVVYPLFCVLEAGLNIDALPLLGHLLSLGETQRVIMNTLVVSLGVASLGTALGFLLAYVQVKLDVPFKRFFHLAAIIPIVSPPFAVAMSIITLFGRSGLITKRLLGLRYDIYGADGLIFALTISFIPLAYLSLLGMIRGLDPALDEAATNLGAGGWHTFRTITLPLLIPGFASSFLLLFVAAMADLGNSLLLGGNLTVLSSRIYLAIIGEYNLETGAVLSVMLLIPSLIIFTIQHYWVSRRSYVTVTGKPTGQTRMIRNPWVKWTLFTVNFLFAALIVLLYGYILVGAFTKVWGINFAFTLDHFRFVLFGYGSEAFTDTILLASLATPIAGLIGILIAFLVVRRKFIGRSLIDLISILGLAVPGTIVGIGLIMAYHQPTLGGLIPKLTGTAFIIIMAYTIRSVSAVVRAGVASLQQIDSSIEEASASLGASGATTFRKITIPLIRPAFLSGLISSFARSMTSLSPIIFLVTPHWRIMTAQILNEAETGRYGNAAAYSIVLIVIVLIAIGLLNVIIGSTTGAERLVES
ncbi:MAG: iron ABC transporter permease [Anaerolineaceae bacterium]|nr:iron ABC transporter permease [Anaerolineaceae bacterium]